jgi:alkyl hydroperoxide reductase subunit F
MPEKFELAIVGGGPAGAAAAIYAARKRLKTVLIVAEWGGQSTVSTEVHNWIGTKAISGVDLAKNLREHTESYAGDYLTILSPAMAVGLDTHIDRVEIKVKKGKEELTIEAKALIVASGAARRKLDAIGAAQYDQKGLTYCASCDGPLFAEKKVAVIGGGNAAFETALQLLEYCSLVTLLNRTDKFRADEITIAAAKANPKMHIVNNARIMSVEGDQFVKGIRYIDAKSGEEALLPVEGVFVEIGLMPNTEWIGTSLEKNQVGQIKIDPSTQTTSHPRVWAAGDCSSGLYHQNNIAAGDAIKALEDVYMFLRRGSTD